MKNIFVKDFMNTGVLTVKPDTPTIDVAKILFVNDYNGIPVVNGQNELQGLITDYDFIEKGSAVHFSPLGNLLEELTIFRKNKEEIDKKIKALIASKAGNIMNKEPITLSPNNTLKEAADLFVGHHRVNPVPVVDGFNKVVGIVSRYDLIKLYVDPVFWMKLLAARNRDN
ncbi:MAG: hypothetical protein A3G49_00525 [Candidatus Sungbacteria bacterium RIFCSPLOWO2_12_FULL_41_11]|uniref:CBS domain-containing protein n=1 Tax=Candidatus Sungbacteria bacterium RIFCSPLOWO2_12_FULL_41_11 TaxID=1802286 RepID=A0A1G2LMW9_9BACT|nr:MAG: CBS domain containing membrane protein [Parcubacteria group bacterium GW2011_GWA2_42_14]OGZ99447.1 MAG: hypothetical protein A3D41_00780 [Candidatus Sungbacteria bacterium RIFCSPHIGHO2_02_FULL_41_12b]OHA12967.1 MAG: hypothetical protein A3G49_00525 [Candidatus Sungbacteria bacterium RIFCSPLOWO2_12_FULL_41_11]